MKRKIAVICLCLSLIASMTGCGMMRLAKAVKGAAESESVMSDNTVDPKENDPRGAQDINTPDSKDAEGLPTPAPDLYDTEAMFEDFLNNKMPVYYDEENPNKLMTEFVDIFEGKTQDGELYFYDILTGYDIYFAPGREYEEQKKDIQYAYIDCGNDGKQELAVDISFLGEAKIQMIIAEESGHLKLWAVLESMYRTYSELENKYGLIGLGGSVSAAEFIDSLYYLNGEGKVQKYYTMQTKFFFGEEVYYEDGLLNAAYDYYVTHPLDQELVLESYNTMEYDVNFSDKEYEEYLNAEMYTAEYLRDGMPYHTDHMYEDGSDFDNIFGMAGYDLYTPEEIDDILAVQAEAIGLDSLTKESEEVDFKVLPKGTVNVVFGADIADGMDDVYHASVAFGKFMKDPINFSDILSEPHMTVFGYMPGQIYGFALRDVTQDDIPELIIDFGPLTYSTMQQLYIYEYDKETGRVYQKMHTDMENGELGEDYLRKYVYSEEDMEWFEEQDEKLEKAYPEYADSILQRKYKGPLIAGMSGSYLVTFDNGIEEDASATMIVRDIVEDCAQIYVENIQYNYDDWSYESYETYGDYWDDPAKIVDDFVPIKFYPINDGSVRKMMNGECETFMEENYTAEDAITTLLDRSDWARDEKYNDGKRYFIICRKYFEDPDFGYKMYINYKPEIFIQCNIDYMD